jgi:hypothetical protein
MFPLGFKNFPLMNCVVLDDSWGTRPQPFGQHPPCNKRALPQVTNIVNALHHTASSSPPKVKQPCRKLMNRFLEIGEQEPPAVSNTLTSLPLDIKASLVGSTSVPNVVTFCPDAAHNKHITK